MFSCATQNAAAKDVVSPLNERRQHRSSYGYMLSASSPVSSTNAEYYGAQACLQTGRQRLKAATKMRVINEPFISVKRTCSAPELCLKSFTLIRERSEQRKEHRRGGRSTPHRAAACPSAGLPGLPVCAFHPLLGRLSVPVPVTSWFVVHTITIHLPRTVLEGCSAVQTPSLLPVLLVNAMSSTSAGSVPAIAGDRCC